MNIANTNINANTQDNAQNIERPHILKRQLGISDVIFLIMANVIGVGIFLTPPQVAAAIESPIWFLAVWLLGGIIALSGAMTSAELGVLMPKAGGDYVFLRESYGRSLSFMYGYLSFTISFTGSVATLATGVVHYQGRTIFGSIIGQPIFSIPELGFSVSYLQILPILIIFLFTALNHYGLRNSITIQKIITIGPIIALLLAGVFIIYNVFTGHADLQLIFRDNFLSHRNHAFPGFTAISIALIPIYFSYAGWNASLYLGEDIKKPESIIPKSMIFGVLIVTGIYLLISFVFLITISYDSLSTNKSIDVASTVGAILLGDQAKIVTAVVIAFLILGSLNSAIIAGSRVYLAMSRDKIFLKKVSFIHEKHGTPHWSLWSQAIWASMLILILGDFESILELTTIMMLIMSVMVIGSIFILRRKWKDHPHFHPTNGRKGYKTFGYPFVPLIYIISTIVVLALMVTADEASLRKGFISIAVIVIGFLIFFAWNRREKISNHIGERMSRRKNGNGPAS